MSETSVAGPSSGTDLPCVLIVDDDAVTRRFVRAVLEGLGLRIEEASDGERGLALAQELNPNVVILDVTMPGLSGVEVARRLQGDAKVLMLTGVDDPDVEVEAGAAGASAYLVKPFSPRELLDTIEQLVGALDLPDEDVARTQSAAVEAGERQLLIAAEELSDSMRRERERSARLEETLDELRHAYLETVRSLAYVVESKDAYTGQHLERCRVYGMALLREMRLDQELREAEYGFLLHDAGKVGVSERILNKPGPLTATEWRIMRTHPLIGYQMVGGIPFLRAAAEVVRYHHEMFDGSGYPEGLRGAGIPLAARVFSIVDAFDAMTTDRPYREAFPLEQAASELEKMAGTQFDPEIVEVFVPMCERLLPSSSRAAG
ncbi:MAG: response regulator [Actinobacteria bacterium]|nr:response regulator [Actinomycetota bacterium]